MKPAVIAGVAGSYDDGRKPVQGETGGGRTYDDPKPPPPGVSMWKRLPAGRRREK
jgi:hypothetical protein